MKEVRVATQAELDAALAAGDYPILVGEPRRGVGIEGFNASYPDKAKASRVCAPIFEVDINGKRIETATAVSA